MFQPEGISLLDGSGKPLILSSKNDFSKQDTVSDKTDLTMSKLSFDADIEDVISFVLIIQHELFGSQID